MTESVTIYTPKLRRNHFGTCNNEFPSLLTLIAVNMKQLWRYTNFKWLVTLLLIYIGYITCSIMCDSSILSRDATIRFNSFIVSPRPAASWLFKKYDLYLYNLIHHVIAGRGTKTNSRSTVSKIKGGIPTWRCRSLQGIEH